MFGFGKKAQDTSTMDWNTLNAVDQLDQVVEESKSKTVLLFKHSTRCSISHGVKDRLERNWAADEMTDVKAYYLDLISFRDVSNTIAQRFGVEHQSPQMIAIRDGKVTYSKSHYDIDYKDLKDLVK